MTLEEIFKKRKSCRDFLNKRIPEEDILKITYAGAFTPSAGGIKTIIYGDMTGDKEGKELAKICYNQEFIKNTHNIILITQPQVMIDKYKERAWRYIFIEAGHIAQNICLKAIELGYGSCCTGAFDDKKLSKIVKGIPLYIISIGIERSTK